MRTASLAPIGSHIWVLGFQLLKLFGKKWELWTSWRICVTRKGLWGLKRLLSFSVHFLYLQFPQQNVCSQLFLPACLCLAIMDPWPSENVSSHIKCFPNKFQMILPSCSLFYVDVFKQTYQLQHNYSSNGKKFIHWSTHSFKHNMNLRNTC